MMELNIDRVGDSFTVDYTAEGIEIRDVQDILNMIVDLYDRQGAVRDGDDFPVSKIEFHGQFKVKEGVFCDLYQSSSEDSQKLLPGE